MKKRFGNKQTLDLLQEAVQKYGDQPFLIAEDRSYSFAEIDQLSTQLSSGMHRLGVKKGDKVALFLEGGAEFIVSRFAAQKLGALVVPINNRLVAPEVEYILRNAEVSLAVVSGAFLPTFQQIAIPGLMEQIILAGDIPSGTKVMSYQQLLAEDATQVPPVAINPDDDAMILYTSGTTGRPKGAVITHRNSVASMGWVMSILGLRQGDKELSAIPMYSASSLNGYFLACMSEGVPWVLTKRFSPEDVLNNLEHLRVTIFHATGSMHSMVFNHPSFAQRDLSALRLLSWSNVIPLAILEQMRKALPHVEMIQLYGFTESAPLGTSITTHDMLKRPMSCGKLDPEWGHFRVVDEQGHDLPPGEIGEVIHKSPGLMREYYKNQEATQQAIRDGWFYTGDLGKFDEEGFLYLIGRIKDMISRGGEKVYAPEVEEVLYQHPAVMDVAVVGVPNEILGEEVKAFVVLKEGTEATEDELIAHCQGKLARFKIPKEIEFRTELPKNPMGKTLKYKLVPRK